MMDVEYNGILASSLGIYAKNIPDIPAAVRKEKTVDIPGMDGTLILLEGGYESTEIKVDFNFIGDSDRWDERFGLAKKWLSKRGGLLRFGCDPEHYYKILKVEVDDGKRTTERVGNFTATFLTKDGLRYLESGLGEMPASDVVDNPYEIAYPIYKITGEGECTLVVNDGKMVANIGQTEQSFAIRRNSSKERSKRNVKNSMLQVSTSRRLRSKQTWSFCRTRNCTRT